MYVHKFWLVLAFSEFYGFQVCITKLGVGKRDKDGDTRKKMLQRKVAGRAQMVLKREKGVVVE